MLTMKIGQNFLVIRYARYYYKLYIVKHAFWYFKQNISPIDAPRCCEVMQGESAGVGLELFRPRN